MDRRTSKKEAILDIILIEVQELNLSTTESTWSSFFSSSTPEISTMYAKILFIDKYFVTQDISIESNAIFNSDCTFRYYYIDEEKKPSLYIQLFKRKTGWFGQDEMIGSAHWLVTKLPLDEKIDIWLAAETIDHRPFVIHVLFNKTLKEEVDHGILSQYGFPLRSIPFRVDVGDIILMNNPDWITKITKWSTWSQWDHVALVCREKGHKSLRLLEATSDGVNTYRLEEALEDYLTTSVIGLRRLLVHRTDEMVESLSEFIGEHRGKPYSFDFFQMLKGIYGANETEDRSKMFCSQLVAAAYQKMGLLVPNLTANNFMPSHFEEQLDGLLINARLARLVTIPPDFQVLSQPNESKYESFSYELITNASIIGTETRADELNHKFTTYVIQVIKSSDQYQIERRYNDFVALDEELRKKFIGIPTLPPKTITGGKMSPKVIQTRQKALHAYLQLIIQNSKINGCLALEKFLNDKQINPIPRQPSFDRDLDCNCDECVKSRSYSPSTDQS